MYEKFRGSSKCKCIGLYLKRMSKVRKFLTFNAAHKLLNAFVLSRLDYCNSLLYGIPGFLLDRLQRVQNWGIRILFNLSKYDHVTFYYTEVHWLPVRQRINFKILLLMYNAVNGFSPAYIQELLCPYQPTRIFYVHVTKDFFVNQMCTPHMVKGVLVLQPLFSGIIYLFL